MKDIDSKNVMPEKDIQKQDLDKSNKINSLDDDLKETNKKIINKKIEKQDTSIKESESNKDIKILQNKKPKSNFI